MHDEGVQILENLANNRVWVIAPIEGRANVHFESCRELSTKNGLDCFFKRNLVMSSPSRIGKPHDTQKSSEKPATSSTAWNLIFAESNIRIETLFTSLDKFNRGCGWASFTGRSRLKYR